MSQKSDEQDPVSHEYSLSAKEFLHIEKSCEAYKDSDEEIKMIFNEIHKLSNGHNITRGASEDIDDVELILKRAEDIALETEILLKNGPVAATSNASSPNSIAKVENGKVPDIKVTKPMENESKTAVNKTPTKSHITKNIKENNEARRKHKARPQSASVIDAKKREAAKVRSANSSPKKMPCKHDSLLEEMKDTNERVKSLELLNVQLNDDNKALRKKLDSVNEQHHVAELKLNECEKFISRIGKEYENRTSELKSARENECRMLAELNKERNEKKNLKLQRDKDVIVIQDLQRQCKEMEMILRRKHPDSVSALIVAAKSSSVEDNKKKLLEERIARLEQELKDKEEHFQNIMLTLQEKFGDMKQKYENHIIDVERQLMEDKKVNTELKNKINKSNLVEGSVQTEPRPLQTVATQTFIKSERASSAVSRMTQNSTLLLNKLKEDSYLVATIKGLQTELTAKQRTIAKINRETEELRKNLRSLQKEKEVLLNLNPQRKPVCKPSKSVENIHSRVNIEMESELHEIRRQKEALMQERASLLESLKRTNEEFIVLKKKRIQDLHTLQLAHEKELMHMNMQIYPLQEEIKLLHRTVEILKDRVRATDKLKYQGNMSQVDVNAGGDNYRSNLGKRN